MGGYEDGSIYSINTPGFNSYNLEYYCSAHLHAILAINENLLFVDKEGAL